MSSRFHSIPRAPIYDDRVSFDDDEVRVLGLDWLRAYLADEDLSGADVEATVDWLETSADADPYVEGEWELDQDALPTMLLVLAQMRLAEAFLSAVTQSLPMVHAA